MPAGSTPGISENEHAPLLAATHQQLSLNLDEPIYRADDLPRHPSIGDVVSEESWKALESADEQAVAIEEDEGDADDNDIWVEEDDPLPTGEIASGIEEAGWLAIQTGAPLLPEEIEEASDSDSGWLGDQDAGLNPGWPIENDDPTAGMWDEHDEFDLPDFDPDDTQDPNEPFETVPEYLRKARVKAAAIAASVDARTVDEQRATLNTLIQLFTHLQHGATFSAMARAARKGLTPWMLADMVALRLHWIERSELWLGRYGRRGEVTALRHGASALTWVLARDICAGRCDYPVEEMIDETWLSEWYALAPGTPGYLSFVQYIGDRVENAANHFLCDAFRLRAQHIDHVEAGDDWSWYRRPDQKNESIRYGFGMINPFGEHQGQIGPSHSRDQRPKQESQE